MTDLQKKVEEYLNRKIEKYKQACFDSSLFISKLNNEICRGIKRDIVFDLLWDKARNGEFTVFISALTLAEVYKEKTRAGNPPVKITSFQNEAFFELIEENFVEVIEINRRTGLLANNLCCMYDLFPQDGIQLASAIEAKCDTFIAWDDKLVGKTHDDIRIEEPFAYNPTMFDRELQIATPQEIEKYAAERKAQIATVTNAKPQLRRGDVEFIKGQSTAETITAKTEKSNGKQDSP